MKNSYFVIVTGILILLAACNQKSIVLFNGVNAGQWKLVGEATVSDGMLSIKGAEAQAVLKEGNYRHFELDLELRTTQGGKGSIWFHAGESGAKGYRIAVNNDRYDPVWWKMTGSLISVRNLTKSFVKEDEWFQMKIRVFGQAVTVSINGEPVVEYIQPENPYRINPNAEALLSEGLFVLDSYGAGEIQFKHIQLQILDAPEPDEIQTQLAAAMNEQNDDIIKLHQENFPVLDYHVHLKGGLTKESAAKQSRNWGINYVLAPNCGIGFPITNDREVTDYLDSMRTQPFILAMQAEGREWIETFSRQVRDEFDFVFTDALTFTDAKGRRTRLWIPEETWIEDEQQYMDLIVDRICDVLQEPMDVYVNPCFLPSPMDERYDEFWTEARMNKFIAALAKSGKALEINARYKIPNRAIIQKAKDAGVKLTFGTNNGGNDLGKLEYCIEMKKACNITAENMYKPSIKI
ncbi:MAG: DUF1080 domain-containing protein [Tannerella sp.]|jgi:hypothetical protein|nr:DUF1080 domain-containing protein [Tannerella sp.]